MTDCNCVPAARKQLASVGVDLDANQTPPLDGVGTATVGTCEHGVAWPASTLKLTRRRLELLTAIAAGDVRARYGGRFRMALPETRWCWVTSRMSELVDAGLVGLDGQGEPRLTPAGRAALEQAPGGTP